MESLPNCHLANNKYRNSYKAYPGELAFYAFLSAFNTTSSALRHSTSSLQAIRTTDRSGQHNDFIDQLRPFCHLTHLFRQVTLWLIGSLTNPQVPPDIGGLHTRS
ncbi:hypothetical protein [Fibrella aquatica]|uniref:hypothetical protein n=1 Tax=Fibrella aquatica TaxID=3242487 RepID=UPI0035230715